jgi:hypothetical protein
MQNLNLELEEKAPRDGTRKMLWPHGSDPLTEKDKQKGEKAKRNNKNKEQEAQAQRTRPACVRCSLDRA